MESNIKLVNVNGASTEENDRVTSRHVVLLLQLYHASARRENKIDDLYGAINNVTEATKEQNAVTEIKRCKKKYSSQNAIEILLGMEVDRITYVRIVSFFMNQSGSLHLL